MIGDTGKSGGNGKIGGIGNSLFLFGSGDEIVGDGGEVGRGNFIRRQFGREFGRQNSALVSVIEKTFERLE